MRVQLQRVKRQERIRENVDIFSTVVSVFASIYIGCHLIWWAVR